MLRRYLLYPMAASFGLACIAAAPASAEVQLSGTQDNVVLQAKNATIGEIVSGIKSALKVAVALTGSTPRQFTGTYEGPLRRVLSRLLDGDNYFIGATPGGMNIVIVSPTAPPPHGQGQRGMPGRAAAATPGPPPRVVVEAAPEKNAVQVSPLVPNSTIKPPVPVRPPVAPRTNLVDAGKSQPEDVDENPNLQGSATTGGRLVKQPAAVRSALQEEAGAAAAANPQMEEAEGNPYFQGSASRPTSIIKSRAESNPTKSEQAGVGRLIAE